MARLPQPCPFSNECHGTIDIHPEIETKLMFATRDGNRYWTQVKVNCLLVAQCNSCKFAEIAADDTQSFTFDQVNHTMPCDRDRTFLSQMKIKKRRLIRRITMWNEPTPEQLAKLPPLYSSEKIPFEEKTIYLHFLIPGKDTKLNEIFSLLPITTRRHQLMLLRYSFHWYIAEYNGEDLFYGYANLGDPQMAEWGYSSFAELREPGPYGIHVIHDTLWTPKKFSDISQFSEDEKPQTQVEVRELPNCNFCEGAPTPAAYDGKTTFGPWGFMCDTHFQHYGIGLGLGKGQKLVLKHKRFRE